MTPAVRAVREAGVAHTLHEYEHRAGERHFAEEAARSLEVAPARVLKTLLLQVTGGARVVAVVPSDASVDLKALASAAGAKSATMADPADAERATGYVLGGISPFGQRRAHRTFVDESAREHATVFVSGGRRGLEIELSPEDLVRGTQGTFARIARGSGGADRA